MSQTTSKPSFYWAKSSTNCRISRTQSCPLRMQSRFRLRMCRKDKDLPNQTHSTTSACVTKRTKTLRSRCRILRSVSPWIATISAPASIWPICWQIWGKDSGLPNISNMPSRYIQTPSMHTLAMRRLYSNTQKTKTHLSRCLKRF